MSSGPLALSERGTLIVPVALADLGALAEAPTQQLGEVALTRKREHHFTVFGYSIGKHVKKALAAHPDLGPALAAAIAGFDWSMKLGARLYHLVQTNEKGTLHTLISTAEVDLAGFFARARGIVESCAGAEGPLFAALGAPPPPHVTLYTSDPQGVLGIGLNTEADLSAAIARVDTEEPGLRAYGVTAADLG